MENTITYRIVHDALAPTEEILRAEFERQLTAQFENFSSQLSADDMDAKKHYDYPNSRVLTDRKSYNLQLARYRYCQSHSEPDYSRKTRRGMHDPDYRKLDIDKIIASIKLKSVELAKQALEGYCFKLSKKIVTTSKGSPALSAEYLGNTSPWSYSHLRVETASGRQMWRTKMIVNVSCLGTLFNQWPTRLVKEGER